MTKRKRENEESVEESCVINEDDLYIKTRQFQFWTFTLDELKKIKKEANIKGYRIAEKRFYETYEEYKNKCQSIFAKNQDELKPDSLLQLLNFEEETKYLNYYQKNVIYASNFFKMPTNVKATAIIFFKRFYLFNSVMEFHPKKIMYTCLFLAAKSENFFININNFVKGLKNVQKEDILDLEYIILNKLKYDLLIYHPFNSLYGFFFDFQSVLLFSDLPISQISIEFLCSMYDKAKKVLVDFYFYTDVAFFFTPSQIALSAFYIINKKVTDIYLKKKFLRFENKNDNKTEIEQKDVETIPKTKVVKGNPKFLIKFYELLVKTIKECVEFISNIQVSNMDENRDFEKKCYFALDPEILMKKKIKQLESIAN